MANFANGPVFPKRRFRIRRRAFIGLLGGLFAARAFSQSAGQAFISPKGAGEGTSWDDAAPISELNSLIEAVGPGGTVYIRADAGTYGVTDAIQISSGGTHAAPVRVLGVNAGLRQYQAKIVGNRKSWTRPRSIAGAVDAKSFGGNTLFEMKRGADNLEIGFLAVANLGRVFDFSAMSGSGFNIHDVTFFNIRDGIYTNEGSRVVNLALTRFSGAGFSKKAVRFHGRCRNWLIENCDLDSAWQYGDRFAVGIEADDHARGLTIKGGSTRNCLDTNGGNQDKYWNGDGVAAERNNRDIQIVNHTTAGNSDGGYDLKSEATTITNCTLEANKRNFRIWGGVGANPIRIVNCKSVSPKTIGGIGGSHHIWAEGASDTSRDAASILFTGGAMIGGEKEGIAIFADGEDVAIHLVDVDLSRLEPSMQKFKATDKTSKLIVGSASDKGVSVISTPAELTAIAGATTRIPLEADADATWRIVDDRPVPEVVLRGDRLEFTARDAGDKLDLTIQARDAAGKAMRQHIAIDVIANPVAPGTVFAIDFANQTDATRATDKTTMNDVHITGNAALETGAFRFKGKDTYLTVDANPAFAPKGPFTIDIEFMLERRPTSRSFGVLTVWQGDDNQRSYVLGVDESGHANFTWSTDGHYEEKNTIVGPVLDPDRFYMVRLDRDEQNVLRMYVDGKMVARKEGVEGALNVSSAALRVSGWADGSYSTEGLLRSILINNQKALTASDQGYAIPS